MIQDKSSLLLLGISIIEDILAISILAMLQSVAVAGGNGNDISIVNIAISIGVVGAFIGSILVIGSKYMPPILDRVGRTNNYTLLLLVILLLLLDCHLSLRGWVCLLLLVLFLQEYWLLNPKVHLLPKS